MNNPDSSERLIAGVDEAGRGPLAGSVVAAAVILHPRRPIAGLTDSKKLSEKKRQALELTIRDQALAWAVAEASVEEIDRLNILHASMLAMQRAVLALNVPPGLVQVDGNRCPDLPDFRVEAIVKGDLTHAHISAASILAKQARDRQMLELDVLYPEYQLARHKGYPTRLHRDLLQQHGVSPIHRRSFRPVREAMLAAKSQAIET
jgi:ribonuclease HII